MDIKKIRTIVRGLIQEIFNEAEETAHYIDRVAGRLKSMYTYPTFNYSTIADSIEIIKKTRFPKGFSYAIKVRKFPESEETTFNFVDPLTNNESVGNEVWAVIRNNNLTSIMFRNSSQGKFVKTPVDIYLDMSTVKNNYDNQIANNKVNDKGEVDYAVKGNVVPQKKTVTF